MLDCPGLYLENDMKYLVICREDAPMELGGGAYVVRKGKYVLATSREFDDQESAQEYADTICKSREARVLLDVTDMGVMPT